mmetsp:Transcript_33360/g.50303  ORF Transcript_33360/g.50303 Transcript_33360/m.50303 type:complete len:134 (+) Transcript_33360:260-661(+)
MLSLFFKHRSRRFCDQPNKSLSLIRIYMYKSPRFMSQGMTLWHQALQLQRKKMLMCVIKGIDKSLLFFSHSSWLKKVNLSLKQQCQMPLIVKKSTISFGCFSKKKEMRIDETHQLQLVTTEYRHKLLASVKMF